MYSGSSKIPNTRIRELFSIPCPLLSPGPKNEENGAGFFWVISRHPFIHLLGVDFIPVVLNSLMAANT